MGLLDDAIREHLELKRRRGADPGEVAREQQEALEPIVRDGEAGSSSGQPAPDSVSGAPLTDPLLDGVPEAAAPDRPAEAQTPAQAPDQTASATPVREDSSATPLTGGDETAELDMRSVLDADRPREDDESLPDASRGEEVRTDAQVDTPAEGDSLEWEMPGEEDGQAEAEEPAEDVLEETPEFLRDTPEQDRLWFEQRPPRDFDFDK